MRIPSERLDRQLISRQRFATPAEVVAWFGAMQAQDYLGALWALGLRTPQATEDSIEAARASDRANQGQATTAARVRRVRPGQQDPESGRDGLLLHHPTWAAGSEEPPCRAVQRDGVLRKHRCLRLTKIVDKQTRFRIFAEAAIGDFLTEYGVPDFTPGGTAAAKVEAFSPRFQSWQDRPPASDDEIDLYLKAHVFWTWRFAQDGWELGLADALRLHQPLKEALGYGKVPGEPAPLPR